MQAEFNKLISKKRKEMGYTQEALGEKLFVTRQTISRWEQGHTYPTLDTLVKLSEILDFSLDTALRGDEEMVEKVSNEQKKNSRRKWMLRISIILCIVLGFLLLNKEFGFDTRVLPEDNIESYIYSQSAKKLTVVYENNLFGIVENGLIEPGKNNREINVELYQKYSIFAPFKKKKNKIEFSLEQYSKIPVNQLKVAGSAKKIILEK